jgi:hypothetical protein
MPVPTPSIKWPAAFVEAGPPEDAAILLTADAQIAGIVFKVMALRMRAGLRMPDYRDGVAESTYEVAMDGMLDDIEDLVDSLEPELIVLNGTQYLLWMVPGARKED